MGSNPGYLLKSFLLYHKKVQYGEGTECGSQGDIKIKFNHETTQQAKDDLKEKWYYKQCMAQKARPEWSARGGKF